MRKVLIILSLFISRLCLAQVSDNFSDGDLTNNPSWGGDTAKFTVNSSFELQLNSSGADSSYLAVPNTANLNNCEWNFWIRLNFSPSSSNNARVYLVSDQQNLKGPLSGYYLQFGEALSIARLRAYSFRLHPCPHIILIMILWLLLIQLHKPL